MSTPRLAEAVALRQTRSPEAATALAHLSDRHPDDAEVAYQAAWAHDSLGLESDAVPYYERALAGLLPADDRRRAYLGLGSTLRVLGRYEEAVAMLRAGLGEFSGDLPLRTFLSMALYNTGESHDAMRELLRVVAEISSGTEVAGYRPAIEAYAEDLDMTVE